MVDFLEYSGKFSKGALESRKKIAANNLPIIMEIESELMENPKKCPDRIIEISTNGITLLYRYPSPDIQIVFEIDETKKTITFFHYADPALQVHPTLFVFLLFLHSSKGLMKQICLHN